MALISREIVYLLSLITAWTSNSNADNRILSKLCTFELPPNWLMQAWKSNKIGPDQSVHANLRACSPGRSGGGAGKGRRACNYVYGVWTSASKKSVVMTSLSLARVFLCLLTFTLFSASRWLAEIWQLSRRGATGELELEFKLQRRSCKLLVIKTFPSGWS